MRKFLGVIALGLASAISAQSPCYTTDYGQPIGHGDNVVLPLQSIGFTFPYDGVSYSDFYVSTNGFIYLRNGPSSPPLPALCCELQPSGLLTNPGGPIVAPFWTDLDLRIENQAQVYVSSSTTECIITWHNSVEFGREPHTRFHVQLKLYPSGEMLFSYTDTTTVLNALPTLVGVSPGNGAPDPGASDLTAGGTSAAGTVWETFDNGAMPFDLMQRTALLSPIGPNVPGRAYALASAPCPEASSPARNRYYGDGCVARYHSFYEFFPDQSGFDLAGSSMIMVNHGNGFAMSASAVPFLQPSPAATALPLGDDDEIPVGLSIPFAYHSGATSTLWVCSNGLVSLGGSNGVWLTPQVLLDTGHAVFANHHDYDPAAPGSGQIYFEEIGGVAYVTWLDVFSYFTTVSDTFQFQFDLATGDVRVVWGAMNGPAAALPDTYLVGYSPAGPSLDPGSVDLSAELVSTFFVPFGGEHHPLGILASGFAFPGRTVAFDAVNLPTSAQFGGIALGLTKYDPGIELSAIGMPGCFQHNNAQAVSLFFPPATGTLFQAPLGTDFLGVRIQAQAAVYAPGLTPNGFVSSNGVEMTLGT